MKKLDLKNVKIKGLFKLKSHNLVKLMRWLVVILFIAGFAGSGFFLYQYVYRTIIQADQVLVLRKEVAFESIDSKDFASVLEGIESKEQTEEVELSDLNNPFAVEEPKDL